MKASLLYLLTAGGVTAALAATLPSHHKQQQRAPDVTAQELANVDFYAQYSAAASCNSNNSPGQAVTCANDTCPAVEADGATTVVSFSGVLTDIRGFVAVDPAAQVVVVSVRGSSSIRNWVTDFIFTQVPCPLTPGCLVHAGFYLAWTEISSVVLSAVQSATAAHPGYTVIATGHSLGGAVATIAAAYIRDAGYATDLYTYGSPRVGNLYFARFVTQQPGGEYRVTHTDDPVPRLPPIILNYRHTSPELWVTNPADIGTYIVGDVEVCTGYANVGCNAGTFGLDFAAHDDYFEPTGGCSADTVLLRSRRGEEVEVEAAEMSDADLEAKLNAYVQLDIAFAANLTGDDA
ncbi:Alpha/Beta hydrolase protein [Diplogelasinospora grovesii]|uniref:Alpha/Beta hydrolase protein n=1 Tax=Diplogelasinospora grovesii TaxID=303347 RepID=A0AAN6NHE9_9PEZI|nr:Alpha/Beta hydrolase protein [Diplogelasinospora grovesii]